METTSLSLLADLFGQFFSLAFVAFGGASALLPELHRVVVEQRQWLDSTTFIQLFAIAQAAPGPNVLVVTLIGWEIAGVKGAIAATLGMCLPMSAVIFLLFGHWERFQKARWRIALQQGIAPLAVGLITASGVLITQALHPSVFVLLLVSGTVAITLKTRIHPLWLIAAGAFLGMVRIPI